MTTISEGLPNIFKWDDMIQSSGLTLSFNALLITMMYHDLGIMYVFTNFLLVSTIITIVYLAVLKFILKNEEQQEVNEYVFVNEETVQELIITLINYKNIIMNYFKSIHQSVISQLKVIGVFYLSAQILGSLSIPMFTWLSVNSLLLYGFITYKMKIDVIGQSKYYFGRIALIVSYLLDLIPKYTPPNVVSKQ